MRPILTLLLPWAVCSQSITTDKSSYTVGEPITIGWNYPKREASNGDWIGLHDDSSLSSGTVPSSLMWVFANGLTQTYKRGKNRAGSVTFDENPPAETGLVAWPLDVGTYQVHIIRDANFPPYSVVLSSAVFTVTSASPITSSPSSSPTRGPNLSPVTSSPTRAPVPATAGPTSAPITQSPTKSPVLGASLSASKTDFAEGEDIVIDFTFPENPGLDAWISLWPADSDPQSLPSPSPYWKFICSDDQDSSFTCPSHPTAGVVVLNSDSAGSEAWPLTCGSWKAYLIANGASSNFYTSVAASETFTVGGYSTCENQVCNASPEDTTSSSTHLAPTEGAMISKIAFSSCYKPSNQNDPALWQHVRANFGSNSVWNWLGDNMYMDSNDSQLKRDAYNTARTHPYYVQYGPVAVPKIPVTGTWDDHDFGINNYGNNYECRQSSQNEFVYHFNVPESDPRHPAYVDGQQAGVYSSNMFTTDSGTPGIHLINLDARYHRSPTFSTYGTCRGASSTMLGTTQWAWLENELSRPSEIKVIGSGTQVLPPTNRGRSLSNYCAYDNPGGTFDTANTEIGEGVGFDGTSYESWAEIPQERTRLLKLAQESINAGNAKHIIFISGDQHWAEIMEKAIPARSGQPAVTVYEVTGSGIDQDWPFTIANSNRLRPEKYGYRLRRNLKGHNDPAQSQERKYVKPETRQRRLPKKTPIPTPPPLITPSPTKFPTSSPTAIPPTAIKSITYSGSNTCSGDVLHICRAKANYGGIEVDWANNEFHLMILTPFEAVKEAARVTLDIDSNAAMTSRESLFE